MTADSRNNGRPGVGFFRSHLQSTPLTPSQADIALLSRQFPEGLFAFLLIGASASPAVPRQAAFFLAISGTLPETPSTAPFVFEESTFRSLSEVPAEATEDVRNFNFTRSAEKSMTPWPAVISLVLLLFLIGTWTLGSRVSQLFRPPSNQIDLSAMLAGPSLKITWDHSTPAISKAFGATLIIMDGRNQRELKLDVDELKLGQIAYARLTKKVSVMMRIDGPGKRLPLQTFDWVGDTAP
jgi:hypothetical protein